MKHPNGDEWAPYLFGEARPQDARRLSAHLQNCPECAAEVAGWQRTLKTLDHWEVPSAPRGGGIVAPVFRWAVAAALVLAAGIAIGRMTAPDAEAMRAQVESSLRSGLASDFQRVIEQSQARLVAAHEEQSRELLRAFSETLDSAREEDRQETLAMLQERQRDHEARYVGLRRDLETVALLADQEIRQARFTMNQLAAQGAD